MSSPEPTPGPQPSPAPAKLPPAPRARTKVVATVGPACRAPEQLAGLVEAGVDVFRLNMAHGAVAEHEEVVHTIRSVSLEQGRPVAILVDLGGPKLRLGKLPGDQVMCREGEEFRFVRGAVSNDPHELVSTYGRLVDELSEGNLVMLADGTVSLRVLERTASYVRCQVVQPGLLRSRQGINLPGAKLSLAALTDADRQHAAWAARADIDFVSLSFVRTPEDVRDLKAILRSADSRARVVAKIEKPEALAQLEEIVTAADAIMIARGDLGVEIDIARVPVVQKQIIDTCNRLQRPVITATQMLDSMQHSRHPTRAEVTDVANAILDGSDACMLSGETAIGEFPRAAVEMMQRIARETEALFRTRPMLPVPSTRVEGLHPMTQACVLGAGVMAQQLDARLIVAASHSGATALALSKRRHWVPTVGTSSSEATLRQMCLYWGVVPLRGAPTEGSDRLLKFVVDWASGENLLTSGDRVILVSGTGLAAGAHNRVVVHEVTR